MSVTPDREAVPSPTRRRALVVPACGLGLAGVSLVVVGTFLPWVASGDRTYRSYAVAGLADRLGFAGSGFLSTLVRFWPFVGPLCLVPVVLAVLRRRRAAGWTAMVIGVVVGVVAGVVLGYTDHARVPGVVVVDSGPWTVIVGGLCMFVAGVLALLAGPTEPANRTSARKPPPRM